MLSGEGDLPGHMPGTSRERLKASFGGWQWCVLWIVRMIQSPITSREDARRQARASNKHCKSVKRRHMFGKHYVVRTEINLGHGIDRSRMKFAIWVHSGLIPLTPSSEMMCDLAPSANPSLPDPARTSMLLGCRDDDVLNGRMSTHSFLCPNTLANTRLRCVLTASTPQCSLWWSRYLW
jgi:hypothetical protein